MGHSKEWPSKKRLTMKRTSTIFLTILLGTQMVASFAMNGNGGEEALENKLRSSIELIRNDRALDKKAKKMEPSRNQRIATGLHFAGSAAAIIGTALHSKALPSTKKGLFGCFILGGAILNLSTRLLGLFFNYQKGNEKISGLKAYGCLLGSVLVPTTVAVGLYSLATR